MAIFGRLNKFSKAFYNAHIRGPQRSDARFPPGTLNMLRGHRGQDFFLRRSQRLGPIFKIWLHGDHTTCIVGHKLARRFLSENDGKVPLSTIDLKPEVPLGSIRSMEGPVHRKYRKLVLQAVQATPISLNEPKIRADMLDRLDRLSSEFRGRPIPMAVLTPRFET